MNRISPLEGTRRSSYLRSLNIGLVLLAVMVSPLIAAGQSAPQAAKRLTVGVALEGGVRSGWPTSECSDGSSSITFQLTISLEPAWVA